MMVVDVCCVWLVVLYVKVIAVVRCALLVAGWLLPRFVDVCCFGGCCGVCVLNIAVCSLLLVALRLLFLLRFAVRCLLFVFVCNVLPDVVCCLVFVSWCASFVVAVCCFVVFGMCCSSVVECWWLFVIRCLLGVVC